MPYKTRVIVIAILDLAVLCVLSRTPATGNFDLYPLPPPERYGNILINRTSVKSGVKSATFSHWLHRRRHTCRVCHSELEFNFKVNSTQITERANKAGRFCGAGGCHDGKAAFGHDKPHCDKCHNGDIGFGSEKFAELSRYPAILFGNRINWVVALEDAIISPRTYLKNKSEDIPFDKKLVLEAEWNFVPPAIFPHKSHTAWLDCNNCHPELFNIKKKGTRDFSMRNILNGEFCGVCHLNVAFPVHDCQRCHPRI
jgi:c(7)-type cytochrome triheme protein